MRFCSRCGFPLDGVSALLANGGILPAVQGEPGPDSPRKKGVRQGVLTILFGLLAVPFIAVLSEELHLIPDALVPLAAVLFFMGGIVRILYAVFFQEGARPGTQKAVTPGSAAQQHLGARAARELPPQQTVPANAYVPPRARTAEIVRPPSVTEGTTCLLDEQGGRDEQSS